MNQNLADVECNISHIGLSNKVSITQSGSLCVCQTLTLKGIAGNIQIFMITDIIVIIATKKVHILSFVELRVILYHTFDISILMVWSPGKVATNTQLTVTLV